MADVTISSLTSQIPSTVDVVPFSTGISTYKATLEQLKTGMNFATVASSGSYNDLANKPNIPTKTSDLTNDSGFVSAPNRLLPLAWFISYGNTIQAQYNVTSVTYTGAWSTNVYYYTVTFTNPLPSTNYTFIGNAGRSSGRQGAVGSVSITYTDNGSPPYTNYPSLKTTTQLGIGSTISSPFLHGVIYGY